MDEKTFVLKIAHDIEKIAPLFRETHMYIRKRRNCQGAKSFRRAIKILDKIEMELLKYVEK